MKRNSSSNKTQLSSFDGISKHRFPSSFMRNTSIQTRLIAGFLLLSLIPLLVTGFFAYKSSSTAIKSKIKAYNEQLMSQLGTNLQKILSEYEKLTMELQMSGEVQAVNFLENREKLDQQTRINALQSLFRKKASSLKNLMSIGIILYSKQIIYYDSVSGISTNQDLMDYIYDSAIESDGLPKWSIAKPQGADNAIIITRKIIPEGSSATGRPVGVVYLLISEPMFNQNIKNIELGTGSELSIINSQGIVVSSTLDGTFNTRFNNVEITSALSSLEEKPLWTSSLNDSFYTVSKISKTLDWYIVSRIPNSYLEKEAAAIRNQILMIAFGCFALALIFSLIISRGVSTPLKKLIKIMREASDGNLSTDSIEDPFKDEIGQLVNAFNNMVANIRSLVETVKLSGQNVFSCANKISVLSESSYKYSEQIANTIQEIARGAGQQASDVYDGMTYMTKLSNNFQKVSEEMSNVLDIVQKTKRLSENTLLAVRALEDKARSTYAVNQRFATDMGNLNSKMKEIESIISVIVNIADQTNLLSLNASIEAARAGHAGLGFAVVAEEIHKLAEQTQQEPLMISAIINEILQETDRTTKATLQASETIKEQMNAVQEANTAFTTILSAMDNLTVQINNIGHSVEGLTITGQKTLHIFENVSAVSQQAAATSEEVAKSTEEQMAGADELNRYAKDLDQMSHQLRKAIANFKI